MGVLAGDIAKWWDEEKKKSDEGLQRYVNENPSLTNIYRATVVRTAMDLGQGLVDVLRLGEGSAEGGWVFAKDGLRLLVVLGPLGRSGGALSHAAHSYIRSGSMRFAVQVSGVNGPCTFQAVNNAIAISRKPRVFVTVEDMASTVGKQIKELVKVGNSYELGAWVDDLIPAIKSIGGRVREVKGLSTIDDAAALAGKEIGPAIFAIKTTVESVSGKMTEIEHSVIAFRTSGGAVKFADYGGKFVDTLDDLVKNLGRGAVSGPIELYQKSISAAVVDGTLLTGDYASKLANGALIVLEGLAAIETEENGVELAIPVLV